MARSCVVIGSGRAGGSFHAALIEVGWTSQLVAARPLLNPGASDRTTTQSTTPSPDASEHDRITEPDTASAVQDADDARPEVPNLGGIAALADPRASDLGVGNALVGSELDLVLIAVPDASIAAVARAIPRTDAVVAHVSGACDLDVLSPHLRVGSIHPLMSLPDAATGSRRLLDACTFAVDGDPLMTEVVAALGGRSIEVPASSRALYHATAAIAANHLTALCAQVEALAERVGVPADAYWTMMRTTLDNVADTGSAAALTGPAARADWDTIRAHLDALPTDHDVALYRSLCEAAARLAGHDLPAWWHDR